MTLHWHIIPAGRVWVDPGGAFGLIPRSMWMKHQTPNENQLIPMDLNSLLVFSDDKTILVDTGLGDKLSQKAKEIWGIEYPEGNLLENLKKLNLMPEDIDIVINTHLHSDHCGGNTQLEGDIVGATFPKATYMVQEKEYDDATHPNARTRATYLPQNYVPLAENGQLQRLDGDVQITKDVRVINTPGHTPGHQSVIIDGEDTPIIFVSDMATYAVHFAKSAWVTAYDVEPLVNIETVEKWQNWAFEKNALIVFQHDVNIRSGHLIKNEKGRFEIKTVEIGSKDL